MASLNDVMLTLGKLLEGQERSRETIELLRDDFQDEKKNAHESRAVIHRRLDEHSNKLAHLETTVAISGEVDAQLRDQIAALKEVVEKNHQEVSPAIEEWKRMKTLGVGISGLIAFSGLTIGTVIAWFGDNAVTAIRHWLKLN
ncbi:putative coiled-coil protein SlyX [Rhizobium sp. BK313]|uniref:DUF1515 family protein n=1 Tax=Rhizobium sp. BK313 TaxID=2587081 RepID=UPI001607B612|nr:DUF1515 family protein [Rhizobium sp. BK313]MBB3453871.1 putative coiled-coil protein SlyX [Rhizobium sp. BK313]